MLPSFNGRTQDFQSCSTGSIPVGSTIYASVAQLGGHLAFNQDCAGSIPVGGTGVKHNGRATGSEPAG